MNNTAERIIVFKSFDSSVEANLAKTKLDAHGIPCFLTEENLANLYPIHNPKFSGVRLHLFEKDAIQAQHVLNDILLAADKESVHCPNCRSTRIEFEYTRKFNWRLLTFLLSLFVILFPPRKSYRCKDCNYEFKG